VAISKTDLKFYLTSLEPAIEQSTYSQSIGGYAGYVYGDATKSLLYPETTLASVISLTDTTMILSDYTNFAG